MEVHSPFSGGSQIEIMHRGGRVGFTREDSWCKGSWNDFPSYCVNRLNRRPDRAIHSGALFNVTGYSGGQTDAQREGEQGEGERGRGKPKAETIHYDTQKSDASRERDR